MLRQLIFGVLLATGLSSHVLADGAGGVSLNPTEHHPAGTVGQRLAQQHWITDSTFAGGAPLNGTDDDQPALQAAVNWGCSQSNAPGGVTIYAPGTARGVLKHQLTLTCDYVKIQFGSGRHPQIFDTSNNLLSPIPSPYLKWEGPAGIPMVVIGPAIVGPSVNPIHGTAIRGVVLDANNLASSCLNVDAVQGPGDHLMSDIACLSPAPIATVHAASTVTHGVSTITVDSIAGLARDQYLYHQPANLLPGLTEGARILSITGSAAPYTITLRGFTTQDAIVDVTCDNGSNCGAVQETVCVTDGAFTPACYTTQANDTPHKVANQLSQAINNSTQWYPAEWSGISDSTFLRIYSSAGHNASWGVTTGSNTHLALTTTNGVASGDTIYATDAGVRIDTPDIPFNTSQAGNYSVDVAAQNSVVPNIATDSVYGEMTNGGTGNTNRIEFDHVGILRNYGTGFICGDQDHIVIHELHARNMQQRVYSTFAALGGINNVSNSCRHLWGLNILGARPLRFYGTEQGFDSYASQNRLSWFNTTNQGWWVSDPSTVWSNVIEDDVSTTTGSTSTYGTHINPTIIANSVFHAQTAQAQYVAGTTVFAGTTIRLTSNDLAHSYWLSSNSTDSIPYELLIGYDSAGGGGGVVNLGNGTTSVAYTLGQIGVGTAPTGAGSSGRGGVLTFGSKPSDPQAPSAGLLQAYYQTTDGQFRLQNEFNDYFSFGPVTPKTVDTTLTNTNNGQCYSNAAAVGAVNFTLPGASSHDVSACFAVVAAQQVQITAIGSAKIYIGATPSLTAGNITSSTVGAVIRLRSFASGNWFMTDSSDPALWTIH